MRRFRLALVAVLASAQVAAATPKQRCIDAAEQGQTLRSEGKNAEAAKQFEVCAAAECPKLLQKDCVQWLGEVSVDQPTITLQVHDDAGHPVQNAHITMDGAEWTAADGEVKAVSPGKHRFVWAREGEAAIERTVVVNEGEHERVILIEAPAKPKPPPPKKVDHSVSPFVWVGYGLSAGAIGAGAGFYAVGLGQRSTLRTECGNAGLCTDHDVNASRGNLIVGDVLVGVGVVGLAVSTYFLVRALTRSPDVTELTPEAGVGALGGGRLGLWPASGAGRSLRAR